MSSEPYDDGDAHRIVCRLADVLDARGVTLTELSARTGITMANLSILKTCLLYTSAARGEPSRGERGSRAQGHVRPNQGRVHGMTEALFLAEFSDPTVGDEITLSGDEGRHAVAVRRIAVGERILLSDGAGTRCV